jgi:hypothetical protein
MIGSSFSADIDVGMLPVCLLAIESQVEESDFRQNNVDNLYLGACRQKKWHYAGHEKHID